MAKKKKMSRDEILALYKTYIPTVTEKICDWNTAENGRVTLSTENKGMMNTILQKIAKKPRISYIHLDEMGSFIWPLIDGKRTVEEIANEVEAHFGEKAQPLYERLLKFFEIVESYGFIRWNKAMRV